MPKKEILWCVSCQDKCHHIKILITKEEYERKMKEQREYLKWLES